MGPRMFEYLRDVSVAIQVEKCKHTYGYVQLLEDLGDDGTKCFEVNKKEVSRSTQIRSCTMISWHNYRFAVLKARKKLFAVICSSVL